MDRMEDKEKSMDKFLLALKERAKELNCLYEVEELFSKPGVNLEEIFRGIVRALPAGWQYPDVCQARITYKGAFFETPRFAKTPWVQTVNLVVQDEVVGCIDICYTEERPTSDEGPFLKEERRLINTIADRLERRIFHENLKSVFEDQKRKGEQEGDWKVILDLLRRTDPRLLTRISRKMLNYLSWKGINQADKILEVFSPKYLSEGDNIGLDENRPLKITTTKDLMGASDEIFHLSSQHLDEKEILANIQKWIKEDRSGFLVKILENPSSSVAEISNAIERFRHLAPQGVELSSPRERGFRVSLIRRLLSDDAQFVHVAKQFIEVKDFDHLLHRVIYPAGSHGRLGGKGAGLFLATQILKKLSVENPALNKIKSPKTWYLTSDGILNFINHNDLEEIVEHKYEDIGQVRQEYPYVVHLFKNSPLPPEIITGLSVALDDFGESPLIVRSSSLLEDRIGTAFAGKYKSLFIANQGSKQKRLIALADAITEVYASTFGPDPIEYRFERGLLDFHEEMGILIQEVVGTKIGEYYLPAFAGVAFSNNEFRWSRRIRREDGLLRMVPGLGTRAVDRLSDDYPVLVSPGQPSLRVNVSIDEKIHYSPKKIDLINLRTNSFETVEIREFMKLYANEYPMLNQLVSVLHDDRLTPPTGLGIDAETDHLIFTFEGLVSRTPFVEQAWEILKLLRAEFHMPVDLEFAHDGTDFYLVQCRPQSYSETSLPAILPRDVPKDRILFSAHRYVPNGTVSDLTHIVYVDPEKYSELSNRSDLMAVGRAISRLNQVLPKRQFILMGPGRWGSRGDIKLGVSVTYSDINNTAMLVEIARKRKEYVPELSFGTHFFQDLVEASIRYLPLYPDDEEVTFNEAFLSTAENLLPHLAPEFAHLADTVRVVDVRRSASGLVLRVLMNAEQERAIAIFAEPQPETAGVHQIQHDFESADTKADIHWRWRLSSVERIAQSLDPTRFGVKGLYLFGSTKNATAGPQSDIDIILHFSGNDQQKKELLTWLEGWSLSLSHMNFLRTGSRIESLLDVHIVTDEDIRNRTSYAAKIGASTDAARPIPLGSSMKRGGLLPPV
ncbi:MAG: phosphoenolpyruvate synthase [Bacteroidetes bacterium]|nr:phosphoenolpyruvate synthase [Bacteroidota bacterium]